MEDGRWRDPALEATTLTAYVEETWFPSKHLEASTRAGYRSNLDRHFLPYFGSYSMAKILPSIVQGWVTKVTAEGVVAPVHQHVPHPRTSRVRSILTERSSPEATSS